MKTKDGFYVSRVEEPIRYGCVVWPGKEAICTTILLVEHEERLGRKMTEREIFKLFKEELSKLQKGL